MSPIVNEQFERLMRKGAFKPILRFVTGADAEDRLAEGIAQTFELAQRKAARGEKMDDALVVFAARCRALDIRRRFVRGGQPRRDALHPANFTDGRTEVFHLDGFEDETDGWPREGDVGLQVAWAAALTANPSEKLDSALDLSVWLGSLARADRALLADRLAGLSLQEVADRADLSLTVAFQRLRRLGEGLAVHSGIEFVKKKRKPRKASVAAPC
jgi:hypothetical protein